MSDVNRQFISNYSSTTAWIAKKGVPKATGANRRETIKSPHILTNMVGKMIRGRRPGS
jgi:hypothetical protein